MLVRIGSAVANSFTFAGETWPMISASSSEFTPVAFQEGRRHERIHLFLAAVLHSTAGSCPVHVRNISQTGALIEGSTVPEKGEAMVLKRTGLEATATIVWKASRKAGIHRTRIAGGSCCLK